MTAYCTLAAPAWTTTCGDFPLHSWSAARPPTSSSPLPYTSTSKVTPTTQQPSPRYPSALSRQRSSHHQALLRPSSQNHSSSRPPSPYADSVYAIFPLHVAIESAPRVPSYEHISSTPKTELGILSPVSSPAASEGGVSEARAAIFNVDWAEVDLWDEDRMRELVKPGEGEFDGDMSDYEETDDEDEGMDVDAAEGMGSKCR
ncbi:hypothetical protein JCM11641_001960 [Rhodosporidiobolus odoratus]